MTYAYVVKPEFLADLCVIRAKTSVPIYRQITMAIRKSIKQFYKQLTNDNELKELVEKNLSKNQVLNRIREIVK